MKNLNINDSNQDKAFLDDINNQLDQSIGEIDTSTLSALRSIRQNVLKHASKTSQNKWQWLTPTPIMLTASIVLILSISLRMNMTASIELTPTLEDIPLLTAAEDIDFYNDLEFYQWLEAEKLSG